MQLGNPLDEDFWEWDKEDRSIYEAISIPTTGIISIFLLSLITQEAFFAIATIYSFYILWGATWGIFEYLHPENRLVDFDYAGLSKENLVAGFVAGALLFIPYLLFIYPQLAGAVAIPIPGAAIPTGATILGFSAIIVFVGGIAVYAEEKFWRMTANPTFKLWFSKYLPSFVAGYASVIVGALAFGYAHFEITGGAFWELVAFGFVAGVLNYVFKTAFAGIGFHFMRNAIALHGQGLI